MFGAGSTRQPADACCQGLAGPGQAISCCGPLVKRGGWQVSLLPQIDELCQVRHLCSVKGTWGADPAHECQSGCQVRHPNMFSHSGDQPFLHLLSYGEWPNSRPSTIIGRLMWIKYGSWYNSIRLVMILFLIKFLHPPPHKHIMYAHNMHVVI